MLNIQEKVSESWKKLIKFCETGNVKLWMHPSLMIGCQLHQDTVIFYFYLSVFGPGKSGKS